MRTVCAIFSVLLLGACATLRGGGGADAGHRARLWEQAHAAYSQDSFRVAAAAFQRLANEHPRTTEGHESRFYLGVLSLEPRSSVDLALARQQLQMYMADDSVQALRGYHLREAGSLLRLVTELQRPCDTRAGAVACDPRVVTRVVTEPGSGGNGDSSAATAEAARLRREVAERDETIRDLREELQRIRNTLAPRRQPR